MAGRTKQLEERLAKLEKSVERMSKRAAHLGDGRADGHKMSLKFGDLHGHLQRIEKQLRALRKH